jgi:hypothetical protein
LPLKLSEDKRVQSKWESGIFNYVPRYTKKQIAWLENHEIVIPDSASFFFAYEIFIQKIYHLKTSNPIPYIIDGGANIGLATIYLKLL